MYSKYYAPGVVEFFCNHHAVQKIIDDVTNGRTYVVIEDYEIMGTGTIDENHITRVFVKPKYQNKGIGKWFSRLLKKSFLKILIQFSLIQKRYTITFVVFKNFFIFHFENSLRIIFHNSMNPGIKSQLYSKTSNYNI